MKRINKFGLLLLFWALVSPAQAGMVATPHAGMESTISQTPLTTEQRQQTVRQLVDRGVDAEQAKRRVAQMTDAQVLRLQGEIDTMPAGGMSTVNLLLIIILILLIV
jgi:hypothetical protein